jgi:protein TonB
VALLLWAVVALLVSLVVFARSTPRAPTTARLPETPASQVQPKAEQVSTAVIAPRLPKPSAARPVGQLQTPTIPIRVASAINAAAQPADTASPALRPQAATDTASLAPSPAVSETQAVIAARQPPVYAIASREEENTSGTSAVAREVVPPTTRPVPPERVVIAAAPQTFSYPIAPSPKLTGRVSLKIFIAADGSVREARIISGNPALADAAVRAVRKWRYRPAQLNGHAAEAETNVTINFAGDDAVTIAYR